jgi:hypothetical protein
VNPLVDPDGRVVWDEGRRRQFPNGLRELPLRDQTLVRVLPEVNKESCHGCRLHASHPGGIVSERSSAFFDRYLTYQNEWYLFVGYCRPPPCKTHHRQRAISVPDRIVEVMICAV